MLHQYKYAGIVTSGITKLNKAQDNQARLVAITDLIRCALRWEEYEFNYARKQLIECLLLLIIKNHNLLRDLFTAAVEGLKNSARDNGIDVELNNFICKAQFAINEFIKNYNKSSSDAERNKQISHIIDVIVATVMTDKLIQKNDASKERIVKDYNLLCNYLNNKHHDKTLFAVGVALKLLVVAIILAVAAVAVLAATTTTFGVGAAALMIAFGVFAGSCFIGPVISATADACLDASKYRAKLSMFKEMRSVEKSINLTTLKIPSPAKMNNI